MSKTTDLTELAAVPASGDFIPIVDVSDTTQAASGTTKRVSHSNLLGYTEYVALLTQTSTNAPTATVIKNDTGATVTWSRVTTGVYAGTFSSAILSASKSVFISEATSNTYQTRCNRASDTAARVLSLNSEGALTDALLSSVTIIIRIYV